MLPAAPLALHAGLGRLDGHKRALRQPQLLVILDQVAAELVARHKGLLDHGGADAAVFVVMQITATNADGGNLDHHLKKNACVVENSSNGQHVLGES